MRIHNWRYIFRVLFFFAICLLFFATRTVFAADEAMTLGAGTKGAGPVGYWNFDEAGGPTAYDSSGSSNNGTLVDGGLGTNTSTSQMWTPAGKLGGCLEFDGTDDYVAVSSLDDTSFGRTLTIEVWVKQNSSVNKAVLGRGQTASGVRDYGIEIWNNKFQFSREENDDDDFVCAGDTTITSGTWYHVVGVDDGTYFYIYVNGVLDRTSPFLCSGFVATTAGTMDFRIGSQSSSYNTIPWFNGLIDEVKIYNRALDADEIRQEYNAGAVAHLGGGTAASYDPWGGDPPVAWWSLDENTGPTAYDRSGSGNDGTISGATWAHGKYGPALEFSGNGNVNCGNNTSLTPASITIEGWVNLNNWASRHIMLAKWSGYTLEINSNATIAFGLSGVAGASSPYYNSSPSTITWNEWHHLVCTWDDTTKGIAIYIDGQKVKSDTLSGSISHSTSSLIMAYSSNELDGLIDDVKIYDYARTQAQVAWDYNKGKPVGWWKMDEATSGSAVGSDNIKDSSGQGNHGSGSGTNIAWTTGRYGGALTFNGTDDYVDCGSGSSLNINNNFSIETWVKTSQNTPGAIVMWGEAATGKRRSLFSWNGGSGNNRLYFSGYGAAANIDSGIRIDDGIWHHCAVTIDSSDFVRTYVDGVVGNTGSVTLVSYTFTGTHIGQNVNGTERFNSTIDDVRIYNYARTTDQIMQDYVEGSTAHLGAGTVSRGRSQDTALASCKAIQDNCSQCGDGTYWIDPDGAGGGDAFQAYCDMNTDGGGWTLVYHGLCTSATGTSRTTGNVVELSSDIRFDQMKIDAVNWPYTGTRTTTETAKMQLTFSGYYQWLHAEPHTPNPDVKFHSAADSVQDVQFTSLGYMMMGYGNSWRRILPVFYTQPHDSYMYLGAYAGQGIYGADDWGYGNYNSHMLDTSPTEHGRGLTPVESQEIKVWIREN